MKYFAQGRNDLDHEVVVLFYKIVIFKRIDIE